MMQTPDTDQAMKEEDWVSGLSDSKWPVSLSQWVGV